MKKPATNRRGVGQLRSRRELLRTGAGFAAAAITAPYVLTSSALGADEKPPASERLSLGFVGVGGMGTAHLEHFRAYPDIQIVAIADVDSRRRKSATDLLGKDCVGYSDYRELLARKDIDAVVIAVPDHWHAMCAIHACEAGKDVYCEKPLSYTMREARRMVESARRCGTVFQVGSQQRSLPEFLKACQYVLSGRIGKLQAIRAGFGPGPTWGWEPVTAVPEGLDWDFWLGPAPAAEFTPRRLADWRWFYDYSGGMMCDWGAHHNDIAQWGNGTSLTGPVKVEPVSVQFPTDGLFETATNFQVRSTYANGVTLDTVCDNSGVTFTGTDGWIRVNRGFFAASDPDIDKTPLSPSEVHLYESPGHRRDWLNCIKTRKQPIADVEIGCRSVTICHLGNIAMRTGKTIAWDPAQEQITNDPSLNVWLDRPYRAGWRI
jgi:predicted dehydrogenase